MHEGEEAGYFTIFLHLATFRILLQIMRFFIKLANNGVNLSEIYVIKANTELETCLGESPKKLPELKSGGLLIKVTPLQQSQRVLGLTSLATCDVSVGPHSSLNTCEGTIYLPNKPN